MKSIIYSILVVSLLLGANTFASEVNGKDLPKKKQTTLGLYLTAKEAHDMFSKDGKNTLFIDVRTPAELEFVGMTDKVDANVPYMLNDFAEWDAKKSRFKKVPNSDFTVAMEDKLAEKGLTKNDTVILMCRSGSRSSKAADLLTKAGYTKVYTVVDGFEGDKAKKGAEKGKRAVNGWKNANLPWTYKANGEKVYITM